MGLLLGACSTETVSPPPKPPIGSLEPVAAVDAGPDIVTEKEKALPDLYVKALTAPAPDGGTPFAQLAPLLNADLAQFSFPGLPPANEPAAIVAAFDKLFGAFDGRKLALSRVWRTPNEQTLEWTMTGTQAREWMGVAATQKPVAFKGVTLMWTKDDGSIIDIHVYFDVALLKAQLSGVGPKELLAVPSPTPPAGPPQFFQQTSTGSADEAHEVAVVKGSLDALENNKEADYVASFADDIVIETQERTEPARGKDAVKAYYRGMHKAIGQLDTTVNNAWGVAQFAIVEYSIAGEQLGPLGWIPAQRDQVIRFESVDVCEIANGKIAHVWRYGNPAQMAPGGIQAPLPVTMATPTDAPLPAMPMKLPGATPATSASTTAAPGAPPAKPRKPAGAK
jgi:hypothetical protein